MKPAYIRTIIQLALAEDLGAGDITSDHLIPKNSKSQARLIAKSDGIVCGIDFATQVFKSLNRKVVFKALVRDGHKVRRGHIIAEISGSTRALLSGERVALNFLSMLSSIATQTRAYVDRIKPYPSKILDTRKTTPLLRQLERYAVRCGGGCNHRFNLNDEVMIKDNHRMALKHCTLSDIIDILKKKLRAKIIVEVDTINQLKEILHSKADIILLDNMTLKQITQAVKLRNQAKSRILLEASGGITLANVKQYAASKVDRISIGALTHTRQGFDISMEFI